jgi:hypothetical protein
MWPSVTLDLGGGNVIEGIDIFEQNTGLPSWSDLWDNGVQYVFHKTNEFGPGSPHQTDSLFAQRWLELQDAGIIRGSFNLVHQSTGTPEAQAMTAVDMLQRLVPGDLGPTLDMEDRSPAVALHHKPGFLLCGRICGIQIPDSGGLMRLKPGRKCGTDEHARRAVCRWCCI